MNVLLVEPDTKLAGVYKTALESAGHTVHWAADAQAAVHTADTITPDVVVLELQLTAHSGIEFLYEFRSYNEWRDIPVILLTMVTPSSLQITKDMLATFSIADILYKPATNLKKLVAAVGETG